MSDINSTPAMIARVMGWDGDGRKVRPQSPDAADVVADRILGMGDAAKQALHPLIAAAYREGDANGYARGVAEARP